MTTNSFTKRTAIAIVIILWPIFIIIEGVMAKKFHPSLFNNSEPVRLSWAHAAGTTYSYEEDTALIAARAAWAARPVDWNRIFVIGGLLFIALLQPAALVGCVYAARNRKGPAPNHLIDRPAAR